MLQKVKTKEGVGYVERYVGSIGMYIIRFYDNSFGWYRFTEITYLEEK